MLTPLGLLLGLAHQPSNEHDLICFFVPQRVHYRAISNYKRSYSIEISFFFIFTSGPRRQDMVIMAGKYSRRSGIPKANGSIGSQRGKTHGLTGY